MKREVKASCCKLIANAKKSVITLFVFESQKRYYGFHCLQEALLIDERDENHSLE